MTTFRRLSFPLCLIFLFALVQATPAQTSVYGAAMLSDFGFTGANYGNGSFKGDTGGLTGGAFYTFRTASRFKAGIDGRVSYSPGYKGGNAYTGALRVGFVPNKNRLRPYFQIGGGVASSQLHQTICNGFTCSTTTSRITNGVMQLDFGLDIRVTPRVDIRAADYGADAGTSNSSAKTGVGFFNAGIVYHFSPPQATKP